MIAESRPLGHQASPVNRARARPAGPYPAFHTQNGVGVRLPHSATPDTRNPSPRHYAVPFIVKSAPILRLILRLLLAGLLSAACLRANSDERTWILADGTSFRAELVRYDEAAAKVVLLFKDTDERIYPIDRFGTMDRAWLAEWAETEDDLAALVTQLGGKISHIVTAGRYPTDLYVYTPSAALAVDAPAPPALILFSPAGKASRFVQQHMEAAEKSGLLLVACAQFRNTGNDDTLEGEMRERFGEVFPQILSRVRLDPARLFMGGTSGGAWRAYHYAAWFSHPWAGIYANGGWLGGKIFYNLPYPALRVAMVNGNLDTPANGVVDSDGEVLKRAGGTVGVFAFEGGHQVPPPLHQHIAFEWLLGRDADTRVER